MVSTKFFKALYFVSAFAAVATTAAMPINIIDYSNSKSKLEQLRQNTQKSEEMIMEQSQLEKKVNAYSKYQWRIGGSPPMFIGLTFAFRWCYKKSKEEDEES